MKGNSVEINRLENTKFQYFEVYKTKIIFSGLFHQRFQNLKRNNEVNANVESLMDYTSGISESFYFFFIYYNVNA